ncbi:vWA domain-containing protein [Mucisphaera calidilacus]|uniref:VWFA domain-containing protein n=1 Tax=Mucisphaera calidilacus TaxID=2527982 RepID=A0A518C0W5_9BACT|nr:hypothetical protein [Mucisphaera calidilacus]QDU72869.1 hypothetical protein Pan265_27450 [Mucisphaera calidilacus]
MVVTLAQSARWTIGWQADIPAWGWVLVILLITAVVAWAYTRLNGPPRARAAAATCRVLALLLIALLLAGPELIWSIDRTEPDRVEILIDRSLSMTLSDTRRDLDGQNLTRDQAARQALAELDQWVLTRPDGTESRNRNTAWSAFSDSIHTIEPRPDTWPEPTGRSTRIVNALRQTLNRNNQETLAGWVIVTDGRSDKALPPELLEQLEQQATPIHAVILGGASTITDVAIVDVQAPDAVFLGDRVPVRVTLEGNTESQPTQVRLIDKNTGNTLAQATTSQTTARLAARPEEPGDQTWVVQITTDNDQVPQNNRREITLRVVDRPVRVLLVDGYPRWEFRFLKNLLLREQSVELSSLLLSADRGFAQEGDRPIQRLPEEQAELEPYDLIILGDIPPAFLSDRQNQLILEHVGKRGAGLIWLGGPEHTPASFADTPLTPLLPTLDPAAITQRSVADTPFVIHTAPAAETLGLLEPQALETRRGMVWIQALTQLKPTAEPLLLAHHPDDAEPLPAVVWMRYGAGQVLYLATDEWWRWRYAQGETPYSRFWLPLVRLAVRDRLDRARDNQPTLTVNPAVARVGQTVIIRYDGPSDATPRITLEPRTSNAPRQTRDLLPDADGPFLRWSLPFLAGTPGTWDIRTENDGPATQLTVLDDSPEFRHTQPDRQRLLTLTQRTGGQLYDLDDASRIAGAIPSRARTIVEETRKPIWSSWPIFLAILTLLTAEWITRRWAGLS